MNRLLVLLLCFGLAFALLACAADDDSSPAAEPADDDDDSDDDHDEDTVDDDGDDDDDALPPECYEPGGDEPTSRNLTPAFSADYYAQQSSLYFDTLDSGADPLSVPEYSILVARWEWPPWLKLTGLGKPSMVWIDRILRLYPTSIPERDCRGFDEQPFGRCHVVFYYNDGEPCPIYEEFTFNDLGEITFIEAWSDLPEFFPTPDFGDVWAQGPAVRRLSTAVPGLGKPDGLIDLDGDCMRQVAGQNEDVADFLDHAVDPLVSWILDYLAWGRDSFSVGCGWTRACRQ